MTRALGVLWLSWLLYWWWAARGAAAAKKTTEGTAYRVKLVLLIAGCVILMSDVSRYGYLGRRVLPESQALKALGVGLTAAGLLFAVWARRHLGRWWSAEVQIKHGHRLIDTGPYAVVRNPIYAGILLAAAGTAAANGEMRGVVMVAALIVAFVRKIRLEEKVLTEEFGAEFDAYRRRTKALLPFVL